MSIIRVPLNSRKYPGHVAIIDADDWDAIAPYTWRVANYRGTFYAMTSIRQSDGRVLAVGMHRIICAAPDGSQVDHIDRNPLNNRRANLRVCTAAQNVMNVPYRAHAEIKYKGVTRRKDRRSGRYRACIRVNDKPIHIGYYDTPEDAARAYDDAARLHFGEFAWINFPDETEGAV